MSATQLTVADPITLKQELNFGDPAKLQVIPAEEQQLATQAADVVVRILNTNPSDHAASSGVKEAIEAMGVQVQRDAARRSEMLKQPIAALSQRGEDGGEVANSLVDLKMQVEELDPSGLTLEAGWLSRLFGYLPGVGTPLKRYFSRYESASSVIDAIINSLKKGQDQLKRDNITLINDQGAMREIGHRLEKSIRLGQLIDQHLSDRLATEIPSDDPRHTFVSEELLFPLRQRIQDLQQQLLVNQQGYLTIELIIRNNKELIRGVDRALNVTISALQVAVTLALALANQRIVLEKIQAITATTDNLIASTAHQLRTQGTEIHKQAASTQLDLEVLKKAFEDVRFALNDVSTYRQQALPKMANAILEMDQMAKEAEASIRRMERSEKIRNDFSLEIEE